MARIHTTALRNTIKNSLENFQQDGADYFQTVRVWRPESLYVTEALSDLTPMAGIEMLAGAMAEDEPTSVISYGFTVYMIAKATDFTAGSEDREFEDMVSDLWEHLYNDLLQDRLGSNRELGGSGDEEIVIKADMPQWRVEAREEVFRAALELLSDGYLGAFFSIVIQTRLQNP